MNAASRALRARLVDEAERQLSPGEIAAYLDAPVSHEERADARALVAWFRGRYLTGADRLAYARRAYRRWQGRT
jgi:predicted component of type VI protein secretion system